jgi:hypothetical protein
VVCRTAHPRDFFGERDCAACKWTGSFSDVKQSTSDQDSSTARGQDRWFRIVASTVGTRDQPKCLSPATIDCLAGGRTS